MKRKFLALLLSFCMALSLLPVSALAANVQRGGQQEHYYNVYVYARFYDENGQELTASKLAELGYRGLDLNDDGWFTYGVIENAITTTPTYNASITNQGTLSQVTGKLNQVVRYIKDGEIVNESIEINPNASGITYELKTASGATDYPAPGYQWHLDCRISVSTLSKYTVHYYEKDTNKPVATDKEMTASIGAEVTVDPEIVTGYTCEDDSKTITISSTESENVITFYYTPNEYTVSYTWTDAPTGENAPTLPGPQKVSYNASYTVATVNSPVEADNGTYTFNGWYSDENMTNQVTELQSVTQNVTLYGQWTFVPSTYTVTYNKGDHGTLASQDSNGNVIYVSQQKDAATPDAPVVTADDGYYFTGWSPDRTETVTGNVTYTAQYAVQTGIVLSVADRTVVYDRAEQTGETEVMVADGYTLKTGHTLSVTGIGYTPAQGTNVGQYEGSFDNAVVKIVDEEGNDVTEQYKIISKTAGKLTITKKAITIHVAGNTKTVEYTGEKQSVFGFEPVATDVPEGTEVKLDVATKANANGTNAGQYVMGLVATDFKLTGEAAGNYEVTFEVTDGWLHIYQSDALTVSVTPIDVIYDGQPHAVEYAVTINGEPVEEADVTVTYSWGDDTFDVPVDAGLYTATVTATKDNYEEATGSATVTIRQREITVTADSASKTYDGTPLTKDTVTASNLVDGHVASATVIGSQTKIGASQNVAADAVIKDAAKKDVTGNYKINYQEGTLTVTGAEGVTLTKTPKRTNVTVGGTITWTVTVTNNGSATAKNLTLTDSIQGVTITGPSGVDNKNFDLEAGKSITFTVTYIPTSTGSYANHVEVSQPKADPDNENAAEKIAQADADPVTVTRWHPSNSQPSVPTLNTEDHDAYIIGYEDGTVRPANSITRAEVATIFFRLLTDESRTAAWSTTNSFSDVAAGDWYNNAVSTLSNAGILTGYSDGTFRPNATITRAEFATIAARFSDVAYSGSNRFTDVPNTHWAARYIALAQYLGWINGYEDNTFRPEQNITRAEAMTLINRVLERAVDEDHMLSDMVTWRDNPSTAWYYEAVQEATNSHEYTRTNQKADGQSFCYENWQKILPIRDWAAFEQAWASANAATNPD